jgi:hypothetical protein
VPNSLIVAAGAGIAAGGVRAAGRQVVEEVVENVTGLPVGGLPSRPSGLGRGGKQVRLRELADDPMVSSADRGWIKQEMNQIERGTRKNIRNPPGKDLAHERGREAAKGFGYEHSNLQDRDLHKLQHKYDDFGKANKERPPNQ